MIPSGTIHDFIAADAAKRGLQYQIPAQAYGGKGIPPAPTQGAPAPQGQTVAPANMTQGQVNQTLGQLQPKTYEYTPQAQAQLGTPSGQQVGVMAQNVEQTPARGMVDNSGPAKQINIPKATSFLLAAYAALDKRLQGLEKDES